MENNYKFIWLTAEKESMNKKEWIRLIIFVLFFCLIIIFIKYLYDSDLSNDYWKNASKIEQISYKEAKNNCGNMEIIVTNKGGMGNRIFSCKFPVKE